MEIELSVNCTRDRVHVLRVGGGGQSSLRTNQKLLSETYLHGDPDINFGLNITSFIMELYQSFLSHSPLNRL